ncbi:MAG: peptidoglycan DD-metalloendopeptidase family protein [Paludibacteraceae bacterium]|nr:peptidoglycan DD-metalloendopeptidase family protein [Paludibacteraceae bacterium]
MRVRWMIIMLVWALLPATAQNVQELQKQQKVLQKQLQETKEMLKQTKKDETATENKLNLLNEDINTRKELIVNIQDEITALDGEMTLLTQERDSLQVKLEEAKADYAKLIRETHYADMQQSPLLFLFSAKNFQQLIRRVQYMRQFAQYRKEQVNLILSLQAEIDDQNMQLAERKQTQSDALQLQEHEQEILTADQRKHESMLKELKKKEKDLIAKQKKQQKKVDELNKQIDELIAKQVKNSKLTKEQQLIAGGFEANKGRLPWPIEKGFISGHFGKHQHPIHANVTINNKGIYLQTVSGAKARAVYEGEVTWCAQMNGSYAVIIQHGNYRSVYSQLKSICVKQGDKVQAKQVIGEIMTNTSEDNKTELYFQIYKDRTIVNPSEWLAK